MLTRCAIAFLWLGLAELGAQFVAPGGGGWASPTNQTFSYYKASSVTCGSTTLLDTATIPANTLAVGDIITIEVLSYTTGSVNGGGNAFIQVAFGSAGLFPKSSSGFNGAYYGLGIAFGVDGGAADRHGRGHLLRLRLDLEWQWVHVLVSG